MTKWKIAALVSMSLWIGAVWFVALVFATNSWTFGAVVGFIICVLSFLSLRNELNRDSNLADCLKSTLFFSLAAVGFAALFIALDMIGAIWGWWWKWAIIIGCILLYNGFAHGVIQRAIRRLKARIGSLW